MVLSSGIDKSYGWVVWYRVWLQCGLLTCDLFLIVYDFVRQGNIVLLVWCCVKFYFVLMVWIDYPTYYVKVLDNRQVYDKQHLLCKQSFIGSPISDYNDTYNILYSLHTISNNPITQYPILYGNSWKLSALQRLIFLQIIYNHLQNLFDKIIVFQIDFYNFNHVIFIPPDQKVGVGLHLQNWKLLLFWQDVFNHRVNKNFSTPCHKIPTFPSNFLHFPR